MNARTVIIFLVSIFLISSCTKVQKTEKASFHYHPDVRATDYYPLEKGNAWTYSVIQYDFREGRPTIREKTSMLVSVESVTPGKIMVSSGGQPVEYVLNAGGLMKNGGIPLIPQPVVSGKRWEIRIGDIHGEGRIVSVSETELSEAGMFRDCLVVEESFPAEKLHYRYVYAPRVGLVKMRESFLLEDRPLVQMELQLKIYRVNDDGGNS